MFGTVDVLVGEFVFETVRFIIMILLLVAGIFIGGRLRKMKDAKKASKAAENDEKITVTK